MINSCTIDCVLVYIFHFDEVWFYSDTNLRAHFSPALAFSVLYINAKIVTILNRSASSFPTPQHKKTVVITAIVASPTGPCTYWDCLNTDTTVLGEERLTNRFC